MDIVFIRDLKVEAILGIFEHERNATQSVVLNLEMASHIEKAARSENIEDALDYAVVAERVSQLVVQRKFLLVETLVE